MEHAMMGRWAVRIGLVAALWAGPAMAAGSAPGAGVVIKQTSGSAAIVAPIDATGRAVLAGLDPGTYSVRLLDDGNAVSMQVGSDGILAFAARTEVQMPASPPMWNGHPMPYDPVVRRLTEQLRAAPEGVTVLSLADPNRIDLNQADVTALLNGTRNSRKAAKFIVADRAKNGAFTSIENFAARICPAVAVDFAQQSIRLGQATVLVPGVFANNVAGLQCLRGDGGQFSLYGRKHSYVGHVTLLR